MSARKAKVLIERAAQVRLRQSASLANRDRSAARPARERARQTAMASTAQRVFVNNVDSYIGNALCLGLHDAVRSGARVRGSEEGASRATQQKMRRRVTDETRHTILNDFFPKKQDFQKNVKQVVRNFKHNFQHS